MKVQDRPETLLIRDIDEDTQENFAFIKKMFSTVSNPKAVKRLINDYPGKVARLEECENQLREQSLYIEELEGIVLSLKLAQQRITDFKPKG